MTAADEEITAAAAILGAARFTGAMTATPAVAALVSAREPLAKLLRETAALHEPGRCGKPTANGGTCAAAHGCAWCGDEDWPCNDFRNALAVARAINGKNTGMQINIQPKPADDAFARGFAAGRRAR